MENIKKVLFIEDNPGDVRLIEETLKQMRSESLNLEVTNAKTLKEAVEFLGQHPFDIVLLDLFLPDSNGFVSFKKLHDMVKKIPIIILTSLSNEEMGLEAIKHGAQDYIVKGEFSNVLLSRAINYAIERKRTEDMLWQSQERYRQIVDNSQEGIWIIDSEGVVSFVNQRMADLLRWGALEILSNPVINFIAEGSQDIFKACLNKCIRGQKGSYDLCFKRKNGSNFWGITDISPLKGIQGNYIGALILVVDITARKLAEDECSRASKQWQKTFDAITDPVSLHDENSNIMKVNQAFCQYFKVKPEDVIDKKCYNIIHKMDLPIPECPFALSKKDRLSHVQEIYDPPNNKYLLVSASPVFSENGNFSGVVHVLKDITELKNLRKELEKR